MNKCMDRRMEVWLQVIMSGRPTTPPTWRPCGLLGKLHSKYTIFELSQTPRGITPLYLELVLLDGRDGIVGEVDAHEGEGEREEVGGDAAQSGR